VILAAVEVAAGNFVVTVANLVGVTPDMVVPEIVHFTFPALKHLHI
jgi:hypothetical protein